MHRRRITLPLCGLFVIAGLLSACTSSSGVASGTGDTVPTTTAPTAPADTTPPTTGPASAAPTTAAGPTTAPPAGSCPGAAGIPAGADIGTTIHGDVDGDLHPDTITEYSLGGVPHVHSTLFTGGQSDAVVQIGFADHVSINFEDFDHSAGAANPPPVAVLAIGATKAGTAQFTFLTNNIHYCIEPWHRSTGAMFVGRIAQDGPYEGLLCDGAAGSVHYLLTSAEPDGAGNLNVTETPIHHNFTRIDFDAPLPPQTVTDNSANHHLYGDITNCAHAPLFP
jgi:hypothetical protein